MKTITVMTKNVETFALPSPTGESRASKGANNRVDSVVAVVDGANAGVVAGMDMGGAGSVIVGMGAGNAGGMSVRAGNVSAGSRGRGMGGSPVSSPWHGQPVREEILKWSGAAGLPCAPGLSGTAGGVGDGAAGGVGISGRRRVPRMGEPPMPHSVEPPAPQRQHGQTTGVRGWLRAAAAVLGGVTAAAVSGGGGWGVQSAMAGTVDNPTHLSGTNDIRNYIAYDIVPSGSRPTGGVVLGSYDEGTASTYGADGRSQYLVLDSDIAWGVGGHDIWHATSWVHSGILDIQGNGYTIYADTITHGSLLHIGGHAKQREVNIKNAIITTRERAPGIVHATEWSLFTSAPWGKVDVHKDSITTFNLEGTTFTGIVRNYVSGYGSAAIFHIDDYGSEYIINGGELGVVFSNNKNTTVNLITGGGVVSLESKADFGLKGNVTFLNNYTGAWGGAIATKAAGSVLYSSADSHVIFQGNSAYSYGGAIDVWGHGTDILFAGKTEFIGNYVDNAGNLMTSTDYIQNRKRGGAINLGANYTAGTIVKLVFAGDVIFDGNYVVSRVTQNNQNQEAFGGAITALSADANAVYRIEVRNGGTFKNNYVYSTGGVARGGAIYYDTLVGTSSSASAKLTITGKTRFEDNYAKTTGGAIHMERGRIELHSTNPDGDASTDDGNIVFTGNRQGATFTLNNNSVYVPDIGSGVSNAIYFAAQGGAYLNLFADAGSKIEFYDRIGSANNLDIMVTKSRAGDVIFYQYDNDVRLNTTVEAGFFRLRAGGTFMTTASYGTTAYGAYTLKSGGTTTIADGGYLRAQTFNINEGGRVYAEGGLGSVGRMQVSVAGNFHLNAGGGIGGYGSLEILNSGGAAITLTLPSGGAYVSAEDPLIPDGSNDANAVFRILNEVNGSGKMIKDGSGTFLVDNPSNGSGGWFASRNNHSGGVQIDEGTIFLSAVTPSGASVEVSSGAVWQSRAGLGTGSIVINDGEPELAPSETYASVSINTRVTSATLKIRPTQTFDPQGTNEILGQGAFGNYRINNNLNKQDTVTTIHKWAIPPALEGTDNEAYMPVHETYRNFGKGLLDIDLGATASNNDTGVKPDVFGVRNTRYTLTIDAASTTREYDARVLLQNLDYELVSQPSRTAGALNTFANARLELGAGVRVIVPAAVNYLGGVAFMHDSGSNNPSYLRFSDVGTSTPLAVGQRSNSLIDASYGSDQSATRFGKGVLDVNGQGVIQVPQANANENEWYNIPTLNPNSVDSDLASLFAYVDSMPLLLRDDFGLPRQLIKADSVAPGSDPANLILQNFEMNPINLKGLAFLNQGGLNVAVQNLTIDKESLTFGPQNDGLYIGAILRRLDLIGGRTTSLEPATGVALSANNSHLNTEFKIPIGDYGLSYGTSHLHLNNPGTEPLYDPAGSYAPGTLEIRAGASTITLRPTTPNTYTGTTRVTSGTLAAGVNNAISESRRVILENNTVFDTGTTDVAGLNPTTEQTLKQLSGSGTVRNRIPVGSGYVVLSNEPLTNAAESLDTLVGSVPSFDGAQSDGNNTFGGRLGGTGDYKKVGGSSSAGTGTLTLTAPNNLVDDPNAATSQANNLWVQGGTVEFDVGSSLGANAIYNGVLRIGDNLAETHAAAVFRSSAMASTTLLQTFAAKDLANSDVTILLQSTGAGKATLSFEGPAPVSSADSFGSGEQLLAGKILLDGAGTSLDIKTTGIVHLTGSISGSGTVTFSDTDTPPNQPPAAPVGILWLDDSNKANDADAGKISSKLHIESGIIAGSGEITDISFGLGKVIFAPGRPVPLAGSGYPGAGGVGGYQLHDGAVDNMGVLTLTPNGGNLTLDGTTISLDIAPGAPTLSDHIVVRGNVNFSPTVDNKLNIWYLGEFEPDGPYLVMRTEGGTITFDDARRDAMNAHATANYSVRYFDDGTPPQQVSSLGKKAQLKLVDADKIVLYFAHSPEVLYWNRDAGLAAGTGIWNGNGSADPNFQDWLPAQHEGASLTPRDSNEWFRSGDVVVFNDLLLNGTLARNIQVGDTPTKPYGVNPLTPGIFPHQVSIENSTDSSLQVTEFFFDGSPINIQQSWRDPNRPKDGVGNYIFEAWNGQDWKMTEPVRLFVGSDSWAVFSNDINVIEDILIEKDADGKNPWGSGTDKGNKGTLWTGTDANKWVPQGVLVQGGIAEFWGDLTVKPYNPTDPTHLGTSLGYDLENVYNSGATLSSESRIRVEKYGVLYFGGGILPDGTELIAKHSQITPRAVTLSAGKVEIAGQLHLGDWAQVAANTIFEFQTESGGHKGRLYFDTTNVNTAAKTGGVYEFPHVVKGDGEVWKEARGIARMMAVNTYKGDTYVLGGVLEIGAGGALNGQEATAPRYVQGTSAGYQPQGSTGNIHIAADATLRFAQSAGAYQVLAGLIATDIAGTLAPGGNPANPATIEQNGPGTVEISNPMNPFNGRLIVNGGTLAITGRLGVWEEAFDNYPTSLYPAVYSHAHHSGDIVVNAGGTLEFKHDYSGNPLTWDGSRWRGNSDYQLIGGNLTGNGTILKTGSAPLIFQGTANAFAGNTTVRNGIFTLAPSGGGKIYGTGAGTFRVESGATLVAGAGTTLKVASFSQIAGSVLVVPPGGAGLPGLKIDAPSAGAVTIQAGVTIVLQLGPGMANTGGGTPALAGSSAAITIQNGVNLQIGLTYIPKEEDKKFILAQNVSIAGGESAFNLPGNVWSPWEGTTYELAIEGGLLGGNKLVLNQTAYTAIPEPSTYALCGGLGLLALALYRKRRKPASPK